MSTANLHTEHVTQAQHDPRHPGRVVNRTFWIVYGDHEATFGHVDDRIGSAWATGRTRAEALANATLSPRDCKVAAAAWDAAVATLRHADGTPVEVVTTRNPYRDGPDPTVPR